MLFALSITKTIGQITPDIAQIAAINWMKHIEGDNCLPIVDTIITLKHKGETTMYIVSFKSGGYAIVTASYQLKPIAGYSATSNITNNYTDIPGLKRYIDENQVIVHKVKSLKIKNTNNEQEWQMLLDNKLPSAKASGLDPFITARWGQGCTYNDSCPVDTLGACNKTLTGCGATAMAQVLHFHNYPETGIGNYTYIDSPTTHYVNFAKTKYQWWQMPDKNHQETTADWRIPQAIYHCGVSCNMTYSPYGSGTLNTAIEPALESHWDYTCTYRQKIIPFLFEILLRNELDNFRPVFMNGFNSGGGGHAFVCDGYQNTNYFHFNWGWEGTYNGYFYLNTLGIDSGFDWTVQQSAVTMRPNRKIELTNEISLSSKISQGEQVTITFPITSTGAQTWLGNLYIVQYDTSGAQIKILDSLNSKYYSSDQAANILLTDHIFTETPGEQYQIGIEYKILNSNDKYPIYPRNFENPIIIEIGCPKPVISNTGKGISDNNVPIVWKHVPGATHYKVLRAIIPGTGYAQVTGWFSDTSFIDTDAKPGVRYSYQVSASLSNLGRGESDFSLPDTGWVSLKTPAFENVSQGIFTDSIVLEWESIEGAEIYELYRYNCLDTSIEIILLSANYCTTFTDMPPKEGAKYCYTIKAIDTTESLESDISETIQGWTTMPATTMISATDGEYFEKVDISWPPVENAKYYKVFRSKELVFDSTASDVSGFITDTSYGDYDIQLGVNYYYFIMAYSGMASDDISSLASISDIGYAELMAPPLNITYFNTGGFVLITWERISGGEYYKLFKNTERDSLNAIELTGWVTDVYYEDFEIGDADTYYYWSKTAVTRDSLIAGKYSNASLLVLSPSAIEEKTKQAISIYPVPADNVLYINAQNTDVKKAEISGLDGRIIKSFTLVGQISPISLNISDIAPGLYILSLHIGTDCIHYKLLVQ